MCIIITMSPNWGKPNIASKKEELVPMTERMFQEIKRRNNECSVSTTINRITAVNAFGRYIKEKRPTAAVITVDNVTKECIRDFVRWMYEQNKKPSYIRCQIANLRSLLNLINGRGQEIFGGLKIPKEQTVKRAIGIDIVTMIFKLSLSDSPDLQLARQIFLFCLFAQGMPLVDAARLKVSNISNGHITYYRQKTRQPVTVKITPELENIMRQLPHGKDEYLLPILDPDSDTPLERQYKNFLQRYNRKLGKISEMIGHGVHLTSYVARHTWATIAYSINKEMRPVSKSLGHSSTRVTATYIKDDNDDVDKLNLAVSKELIRHVPNSQSKILKSASGAPTLKKS